MSDPLAMPVIFEPVDRAELNACLLAWGHRMVPVRRPTFSRSHGLRHAGELVAVVATYTLIRARVTGFDRREAIELSRLCAVRPDLCRVALRLWRAFVFPGISQAHGICWALNYQDVALHSGNLYRFDGWVRIGRSRSGIDPRTGRRGRTKVVWGWCEESAVRAAAGRRSTVSAAGLRCEVPGWLGQV